MSPERYAEVDRTGSGLTLEERRAGWHFCSDFDELLTDGELRTEDGCCAFCGFDGRLVKGD